MFKHLSVAGRMTVSFAFLLGLLIMVSLAATLSIRGLGRDLQNVAERDMQILQRAGVLQVAVLQIGTGIRDVVGQESLKVQRASLKLIAENRKVAETAQADLLKLVDSGKAEDAAALQATARDLPVFVQEVAKGAELIDVADYDGARRHILEAIRPVQLRLDTGIAEFFRSKTEAANATATAAGKYVASTQTILLALTLIGVAAGVAMAWLILRSVVVPLRSALEFARRVADGDLSGSIRASGQDEVGTLVVALESMRQSLAELIGRIRAEGDRVSQLAVDLSSRTAAATEHANVQNERIVSVSAAMEEISVSVSAVSENAEGVSQASRQAQSLTRAGNEVMQSTLHELDSLLGAVGQSDALIRELASSVENIRGIAHVIKEIADQTNLLALNAAIEAARAGEQGRGFAVVADEVRKLAERTAMSTADIASKVSEISHRTTGAVSAMESVRVGMEADAEHSRQVGEQLRQILGAAEAVTSLAKQIADASREQATGSQQVAHNIEDIARISEETRDAVVEAGNSATRMSQTAETLQQLVARFRLS
ncbi:MAG: methyl-accepting chemotaxis protein [Candidatus Accumulibacter similis]|nr:MAG: methyl-accepting chemotaxis protein [Candidatus Accumulibacter similis]